MVFLLRLLREHPRWSWFGLVLYAIAVTTPHDEVQNLVAEIAKRIGRGHLYQIAGGIGIGGGVILSAIVLRKSTQRVVRAFYVVFLCIIVVVWRFLTANNTELVHYPQYIVEGAVLLVLTLSPLESLAWVTIFGGLDETFQYAVLHSGWGIPLDFNDIYMDVLGGALGIVLATVFLNTSATRKRVQLGAGSFLILAMLAAGAVLLASGKMLLVKDENNHQYWFALSRMKHVGFWFFDETWGPHVFHTMLPLEGIGVILATLASFAFLDSRIRIKA